MSYKAKERLAFVKSLKGRDKNGGKELTMVEKKKLFVMKLECPCLSCSKLERSTFFCPDKKCKVNPYNERVCESYIDRAFKHNKESSEEVNEQETQESSTSE